MSLRADPTSIAPDRAIVFEIAGSVSNFYKAVSRIKGLEFIAEDDAEYLADDDFALEGDREAAVPGKFYLAMPDAGALEEILRLYRQWRRGRKLPRGSGPWKDLFKCLRTMRPWGPEDRITEADIAIWREELSDAGLTEVRVEAEFFFAQDTARRAAILDEIQGAVDELGGEIITTADIPVLSYHAALIRLPTASVQSLTERAPVALVLADQIMFIRPQASMRGPLLEEEPFQGRAILVQAEPHQQPPIAALLDGFPVQNHDLLANRLIVNDPDDVERLSVVGARRHGTAMASLILHGDLNDAGASIERPLYVHPLLYAGAPDQREQSHPDRLLVDTIYRAVVAMKDPEAPGGPAAPDVFIVNVSLGDPRRLYGSAMSPLAKLFDHLAHRYNLLFLISAGNMIDDVTLPGFDTLAQLEAADPHALTRAFLAAVRDSQSLRTLMSPAEGLNPLTIGALHADAVVPRQEHGSIAPYAMDGLPNVSSALGLGHRRVVKPDLLLPGGRERLRMRSNRPMVLQHPQAARGCGLRAAAPDVRSTGRLGERAHLCGTSAATALATRSAHLIYDGMMDIAGGSNLSEVPVEFWPVVVKALLVHGARWDPAAADVVAEVFGPADGHRHIERVDNISRLLGYGVPNITRVLDCSPSQATLVGYGEINATHAHQYRIPLPECLEAVAEPRSVVVTIAWFSPVSNVHLDYRRAQLHLDLPDHRGIVGVQRLAGRQPTNHAAKRGSVAHEIYSGEDATVFLDNGFLVLNVWCRERPNGLRLAEPVRYAVAITIEAGEALPIYEETVVRLRQGIRPR